MRIDLSRVIRYEESNLPVSACLALSAQQIGGVVERVDEPFQVKGIIKNIRGVLTFDGTITGRYTALCSRCNAPVPCEFSADFSETIEKSADETTEDAIVVVNDGIELDELVLSTIILHLPMRVLCSETCKGLCPECGKNRNIDDCSCESSQVDDRLAVLQGLLHKQSKEE